MTTLPVEVGSSGRTCAADAALSNTISNRRSALSVRHRPACSSSSIGTARAGTPSARRNRPRTSVGSSGAGRAEVGVELSVGKGGAGLMPPPQRQRGLADTGQAGQQHQCPPLAQVGHGKL
jgi:hypothetical protein